MSGAREESPDWLRSFQPPTQSAIELSSGSESPLDRSPESDGEDSINLSKLFKKEATKVSGINDNGDGRETESSNPVKEKSSNKNDKVKRTPERKRKRKNEDDGERGNRTQGKDSKRSNPPEKHGKSHEENRSIWSLSSDSESSPDARPAKKGKTTKKESSASANLDLEDKKEKDDILLDDDIEFLKNQAVKVKSPKKRLEKEDEKSSEMKNITNHTNGENDAKNNLVKGDISGKHPGPQVSSSRLPLLLPEKVQRTKALVECEGDSIDLSGDVGSVGRIVISDDPSRKHEMFLDLKGTIYKTTIVPSRTFCVVSFGQSEAKIEAIMNDYIQLKPQSNIYEAETMVEGTLDGFSFDSEDEADKTTVEADQLEGAEEQPDGKTKRKSDKTSGLARNKGKPAAGKPPKKVKKKPQVSKKGKTKK